MVDFAKYLKNPPQEDSSDHPVLRGTLKALVCKKDQDPSERSFRACEWEIGPYPTKSFGVWTSFRITEGGVTGYESFVLRDDQGLNRFALDRIFTVDPGGDWCACAGSSGWDEMYIPNLALREAIQQWLDLEGITFPD